MTKEQKAAMRAKREANKSGKANAFVLVAENLKLLSYEELNNTISLANGYRKEIMGVEKLKLTKEKEEINIKLQKLQEIETFDQ